MGWGWGEGVHGGGYRNGTWRMSSVCCSLAQIFSLKAKSESSFSLAWASAMHCSLSWIWTGITWHSRPGSLGKEYSTRWLPWSTVLSYQITFNQHFRTWHLSYGRKATHSESNETFSNSAGWIWNLRPGKCTHQSRDLDITNTWSLPTGQEGSYVKKVTHWIPSFLTWIYFGLWYWAGGHASEDSTNPHKTERSPSFVICVPTRKHGVESKKEILAILVAIRCWYSRSWGCKHDILFCLSTTRFDFSFQQCRYLSQPCVTEEVTLVLWLSLNLQVVGYFPCADGLGWGNDSTPDTYWLRVFILNMRDRPIDASTIFTPTELVACHKSQCRASCINQQYTI